MKTRYIHYGASEFHKELMLPISNRPMFVKPYGGLWASPVDSPRSWYDWCMGNNWGKNELEESFSFALTDNAKILHLFSVKQLEGLPRAKAASKDLEFLYDHDLMVYLDFEAMEKEYDGIELHLSEENWDDIEGFGSGLYYKLYGWDCDSILLFHDDVIQLLN